MPSIPSTVKPKPTAKVNPKYTVFRDTREQQGWVFDESATCAGTVLKALKTGDYTLEGFEDILCIERKKNVSEFARNIVEARFDRELVRLEKFPMAFIVAEFTIEDIMRWPLNSGIPKHLLKSIRISKYFILKRLIDFQTKHPTIQFIMAGPHGKDVMLQLFKRAVELYGKPVENKTGTRKTEK